MVSAIFFGSNFFAQNKLIFKSTPQVFFPDKNVSFVFTSTVILNTSLQIKTPVIRFASADKLPVFCAMEDKLYKRLNVWIKLRTGSDEYYRTLIALPRETKNQLSD